ncbi:MAG TPA: Gfo/Idh/MocA family oxidoreductase [Planctomycetaceae bacterium]|nr:Gfo/Idh/MocA family oxidoreductase [Planctomycetaceae bacterium]
MANKVRIAIIGAGAVADYHHVPGIRLDPRAELVAACDQNEQLLAKRRSEWALAKTTTNYAEIASDPAIDAVIICTPNDTHFPVTLACLEGGKHVMCEKPLGLSAAEATRMYATAREKGLRHMTAFTYRFAPAMRYLRHLVASGKLGVPRHFRSQRFLDWPETSWGWRQYKKQAGAGDLFDMTIHRIDYAQDLMGRMTSICGAVAQFVPRDKNPDGTACLPSEVDDWSALICQFERGGVGVLEGTTLAKGYHFEGFGHDWAEINGSEATAVYQLKEPNTILFGKHGESLTKIDVPGEFLKPAGSPRDPRQGVPSTVFRYDLSWEFVSAIVEGRDAVPGFNDGASAQAVADAVLESFDKRTWVIIDASPW